MEENASKKDKPEPQRPGWIKELGEVALGLGLVTVLVAALMGVWQFLVKPLFYEGIVPILSPALGWLGHINRDWGFGWAVAAFIGIVMIIAPVVAPIPG